MLKKKIAALLLAAALLCCVLAGCGGEKTDADMETYTYVLAKGEETFFYEEYEDHPLVEYWLSHEWDADGDGTGKKIAIDFITLPSGSESDNINTMISTGEYPMIMDVTYSSMKALQLYEKGYTLDITEYVENYMPNYLKWIEEHPELGARLTNTIDGEKKYISLWAVNDAPEQAWGGYCYRRDWIVNYGTNPVTGEPFSGQWVGDSWEDNVVFPSGNTDPIYISDWEWMMEIFATALEEQGITDGYCMSLYYPGGIGTGDFMCGFGFGASGYYIDKDGVCQCGFEADGYRAYLECMSTWYANGWIDERFDERSNDMFYMVDTATTFAGKVGAWYGQLGTLGGSLDTSNGDTSDPTYGAVVFGAPQPINDVYGSDAEKYQTPYVYYENSLVGSCIVFTDKCEGMDLATLFTALDYLYAEDGGALLKSYGLTAEEVQEINCEWYVNRGLENGSYSVETDDDGNMKYTVSEVLVNDQEGLESACKLNRILGLSMQVGRQYDYPESKQHSVDMWMLYDATGNIGNEITSQLTAEQQKTADSLNTYVNTYTSKTIPKFIKGELDINSDEDWGDYCTMIQKYNPYQYCDFINGILQGN